MGDAIFQGLYEVQPLSPFYQPIILDILHLATLILPSFESFSVGQKTSQELRMLSTVTLNCQDTMIFMIPSSQLSKKARKGHFSHFGGTKNVTSGARIKIIIIIKNHFLEALKANPDMFV